MKAMSTEITQYGFKMGPVEVQRICFDPKHGAWIRVMGKVEDLEIRVTAGGRIRVGEVKKLNRKAE